MLDPQELTVKLKRAMIVADDAVPNAPARVMDLVDGVVTLDPENVPEFPSTSRNNVHYFGCEQLVSSVDVDRIVEFYNGEGVSRFFIWLSPNGQLEEIRLWLVERGFQRWQGTGYPTLLRSAERLPEHQTDLVIRQVDAEEAAQYTSQIGNIYADPRFKPIFVETCGAPGHHHFLAFAGDQPVSAGLLTIADDLGVLGWMATAEHARGQGGQSALIVDRVNLAEELGCQWVSGSTLYALESSLENMQRKGFEIVFDREVYGFGI